MVSDERGIIPVHGVQHFNGDQDGQSHCHGMGIAEDLAVDALEVITASQTGQVMGQMPVGQLWTRFAVHEPPGGSTNGSGTDITTNSHITEDIAESISKITTSI